MEKNMRTGLSKDTIIRILGGAPKYTIAQLEEKYPSRNLPAGAMVTRNAPSPTGFAHIGTVYQMLIDKKVSMQTDGVFYIRVEDTDTKREVVGAMEKIFKMVNEFGVKIDEGVTGETPSGYTEIGGYGPYVQTERKDIYHSVAAQLLSDGRAYPCFLTPEEMEQIREKQAGIGAASGIYGCWARDRDLTEQEIIARLDAGEVPTVRLYSTGDPHKKVFLKDEARGSIAFPESDEDLVLIKSNDGLPTYHFAHLVDDHFMRTTLVVRGVEWLASLPRHAQLFKMMGWDMPMYIHTNTLDKFDQETGNQRKLSKRKDPEADASFFLQEGYPTEAVLEYILNIAASGYEEAKAKDPSVNLWNYPIKIKKIPQSNALFNMAKVDWWAREFIATLSVEELTSRVIAWAGEYDAAWLQRIQSSDKEEYKYLKNILGIERDNPKRVRKDFVTWKQTLEEISYFYDVLFQPSVISQQSTEILSEFLKTFDISDDKDIWWNKIQAIATKLGIKNGEVAMILRVALTGRNNTPDLYSIMQVMGDSRVRERFQI
jgi:glutamyl-tRNA synthetase